MQVRILVEEGLSPGVNMCENSIFPRANPSDETINWGPRHRPVCVANRVAKSSRDPAHKVFEQLDYKPQNLHFGGVHFFVSAAHSPSNLFFTNP